MHGLNEHIPLPEKCGELVCEEGLVAEESPLLAGAAHHNVSHPEELTLVFRSLFPGSECCLLPVDDQDRNNRVKMVQEGILIVIILPEEEIICPDFIFSVFSACLKTICMFSRLEWAIK